MLVDFLIVYDAADRSAAEALRTALEDYGASCLLRVANGADLASATSPLSRMMSECAVVVLVVSERAGTAFWRPNDIATIHSLLAEGTQANRIVLVLESGRARGVLPRDLVSSTAYDAAAASWGVVAADLAAEARSTRRPATVMVGHSMAIVDAIWDDLVTAGMSEPAPALGHRQLFETVGDQLVVSSHGQVLERITPDEYEQRLTPGQLEDVSRIEKSMEINLAEWRRVYPTRAVNAADRASFLRVKNALGEDLNRAGHLLVDSGFWLDDHYLGVRDALRSNA